MVVLCVVRMFMRDVDHGDGDGMGSSSYTLRSSAGSVTKRIS
jgi:hypothetical protein